MYLCSDSVLFQGQPSYVRVYRYPNFGGPAAAVANKSFYKADRVHMYWNKIGRGLCGCMNIKLRLIQKVSLGLVDCPSQLQMGLADILTALHASIMMKLLIKGQAWVSGLDGFINRFIGD